jgi:CRP/FNR family transcriptional regulator, anaerobic regulatory protein
MSSDDLSSSLAFDFDPTCEPADPSHICCHVMAGATCDIRGYSMCNVLEGAASDSLESLARPTDYPARTQLYEQGAPVSSVYNITAGVVRLSKILTDGRRQVLGFALPGDFIGLTLAATQYCSAETITPVTACHFERSQFDRLMKEQPTLTRRLYELTASELTRAHEHVSILGCRTADEKVACFLLEFRTRLARRFGVSDRIPLPMSRQDIADHLGLTIETVSRMFMRMDRDRTLAVARDHVRILDLQKLQLLAAV